MKNIFERCGIIGLSIYIIGKEIRNKYEQSNTNKVLEKVQEMEKQRELMNIQRKQITELDSSDGEIIVNNMKILLEERQRQDKEIRCKYGCPQKTNDNTN